MGVSSKSGISFFFFFTTLLDGLLGMHKYHRIIRDVIKYLCMRVAIIALFKIHSEKLVKEHKCPIVEKW